MLAITILTILSPLLTLLQGDDGGLFSGTSLIILLIILALILALFWWGLTRNRSTGPTETTHDTRDDYSPLDRVEEDHLEEDHFEEDQLDTDDLDLEPADLNVGRVPDPYETTTLPPEAEAAARTGAEVIREPEPDPNQPIDFNAIDLDATGTAPPGDQVELDVPVTRFEPVDVDDLDLVATGNVPPVLEDQSEMVPGSPETSMPADMPASVISDDLQLIEGIGPRIAAVLADHGITTFADLADAPLTRIQNILDQANLRLANPETWAEQAQLAAAGRWDDLRILQDRLKGGRNT
jgi:predicted flap endonuclease-1-like 5' DNA nuclease